MTQLGRIFGLIEKLLKEKIEKIVSFEHVKRFGFFFCIKFISIAKEIFHNQINIKQSIAQQHGGGLGIGGGRGIGGGNVGTLVPPA